MSVLRFHATHVEDHSVSVSVYLDDEPLSYTPLTMGLTGWHRLELVAAELTSPNVEATIEEGA